MSKHEFTINFLSSHGIEYVVKNENLLSFDYDGVHYLINEEYFGTTCCATISAEVIGSTQYDYHLLCEVCNLTNIRSVVKCCVIGDNDLVVCGYEFCPDEFEYDKYFFSILTLLKVTSERFFINLEECLK